MTEPRQALTTRVTILLREHEDVRHLPDTDPRLRAWVERKHQLVDELERRARRL